MQYPGGKNGGGTYHKIINLIPPHDTYIETHLGSGAIMRYKAPAKKNIGIDLDIKVFTTGTLLIGSDYPADMDFVLGDCLEFLRDYHFVGNEFIYCDPPYLINTRRSNGKIYKFEYAEKDHIELLTRLNTVHCKVMISGYYSKLYNDMLSNWETVSFQAQTRAGLATEYLWMNYNKPIELHDYRYLGENKTQRQMLKRQRERWINRLNKMSPLKKQALLSVLKEIDRK